MSLVRSGAIAARKDRARARALVLDDSWPADAPPDPASYLGVLAWADAHTARLVGGRSATTQVLFSTVLAVLVACVWAAYLSMRLVWAASPIVLRGARLVLLLLFAPLVAIFRHAPTPVKRKRSAWRRALRF